VQRANVLTTKTPDEISELQLALLPIVFASLLSTARLASRMTPLRSTEKETDYCSEHPGGGLCRKFLGKGKGKNDGKNKNESKNLEDKWAKWPAPGLDDTELGVLMELEVGHGETEVYARVQA
jgi:hypothetical protein